MDILEEHKFWRNQQYSELPDSERRISQLQKALYGLKQAPIVRYELIMDSSLMADLRDD